jgi:hypothetical protein
MAKPKAPKFPKRDPPRQSTRKPAGTKPPSDVTSCARKVANYRYRKDLDYKKYLKEKAKARVAKEKAEKTKKKVQETKAQKEKEAPRRKLILKIPKQKKK